MKKLTLIFALVASSAFADEHDQARKNMQAQCEAAMYLGTSSCRVALDAKDYPKSTVLISGVGRVSTAAYLKVRGMGGETDANGKYKMCSSIPEFTKNWDSDEGKVERALWSQEDPVKRPPSQATPDTVKP